MPRMLRTVESRRHASNLWGKASGVLAIIALLTTLFAIAKGYNFLAILALGGMALVLVISMFFWLYVRAHLDAPRK
jgi:hypothetical protein